jgi:hypothetical protein
MWLYFGFIMVIFVTKFYWYGTDSFYSPYGLRGKETV